MPVVTVHDGESCTAIPGSLRTVAVAVAASVAGRSAADARTSRIAFLDGAQVEGRVGTVVGDLDDARHGTATNRVGSHPCCSEHDGAVVHRRARAPDRSRSDVPLHEFVPHPILNHMVQNADSRFDASFAALSDSTRRGVLEQLGRADASISALAERFGMSLTGMKKHVGVLEQAGLVTTAKVGRVRTCRLGRRGLQDEAAWIAWYRTLWHARFDALDTVVEELTRQEITNARRKRT